MHAIEASIQMLRSRIHTLPQRGMILGSGWNNVLQQVTVEAEITYADLFGVSSGVPGHEGKLVLGTLGTMRIVFMAGRFHTYEGYTAEEVTRPLQVCAALGVKEILITAAVGGINESYRVGDFVILSDMITLLCPSPLRGAMFVDLSQAFDPELCARVRKVCVEHAIRFHEGVYVYTRGPHFETPADKMTLHTLGGDVVGMSTVPETIMARSLGMKVIGLSFVTNLAFVKHKHEDVLAAANAGSKQMVTVLSNIWKE